MSGSTGFDYQVVSPAELRRRAVEAATARVMARQASVRVARASVGKTVAAQVRATQISKRDVADLDRLRGLEIALAAEEQALSVAAAQARTDQARRTLATEIEALQVALPKIRFRGTARERSRGQVRSEASERLAARVEAVLDLALGLDESVRADLQKLAAVVTDDASGPAKAQSFLTELETRISQAVKRQRAEERRQQRTRELKYQYAVLLDAATAEGDEARAIVARLPGGDVEAAARELQEVDLRRVKAADRRFALDQATAVLREMGYAVDVEPAGGTTIATASGPDWPRHGLKLVFPADTDGMRTIPVAFEDSDERDDLAFETSSCDAVDELRDGLQSRGVPTELIYRTPPGELPVRRHARQTAAVTSPKVRRLQR
ncbi:hypothetical protein ACQPYH_22495 [Kribbella sp. CA-245084]|uniref:hypothetical protein n=1 Tax=Kribbella sp. CA-245084 TaxID=3239940 RepID=UPI003D8F5C72